jgi:hypothetical protein
MLCTFPTLFGDPSIFLSFFFEWPRSRFYRRTAALRLIVQPCDEDDQCFFVFPSNGAPVEWNWQGKTEVLGEKTYPSATLSTTNLTWTDSGSNPGLRSERPATNRLNHGTAFFKVTCGHGDMFAVSGNTALRRQIENGRAGRAGVQSHRVVFLLSSADKRICSSFAYRESLLLNYLTLFPSQNSQTITERVLEGNQIVRSCLNRILFRAAILLPIVLAFQWWAARWQCCQNAEWSFAVFNHCHIYRVLKSVKRCVCGKRRQNCERLFCVRCRVCVLLFHLIKCVAAWSHIVRGMRSWRSRVIQNKQNLRLVFA